MRLLPAAARGVPRGPDKSARASAHIAARAREDATALARRARTTARAMLTVASARCASARAESAKTQRPMRVARSIAPRLRRAVTTRAAPQLPFDPREYRRELGKSSQYSRKFLNDEEAATKMANDGISYSKTGLVATMKANGFAYAQDGITFKLADAYGFCWGVERAVQMAYEARKQFPESKLWITNEIIHNPTVNERLSDMGVNFIEETDGGKDFSGVKSGEVVILPAFGASVHEMKFLADRGANIVDTTCPWVSKVWNAVDQHKRKEFTSIIHGKYSHEETVATASFATTYLVVKDMKEANYVRDYILKGGDKAEFMAKFKNAMSQGFDPDEDLQGVGIANQTTMLKGETEAIGKLFQQTMMEKYGVENVDQHFIVMDTICDATQERQDAMYKLVDAKPDIMLVVGGFNSSNTSHLQEIAEDKSIPSYWVDRPDRLDASSNSITHKLAHGELVTTDNWLPSSDVVIGITSGASTPDKVVEDVIEVVFATKRALKSAVSR